MNNKAYRQSCLTIILATLILSVYAGDPIEKTKKNLLGTWHFYRHWNPYKNNGEPGMPSSDPKLLHTAYTFYDDGHVVVWSKDSAGYKIPTTRYTWGIVYLETSKGKKVPAIKIVDSSIDPKNQQAIEVTTSGKMFYIVQLSKTFLSWIPIPSNGGWSSRDTQNTFNKVTTTPPNVEQGL